MEIEGHQPIETGKGEAEHKEGDEPVGDMAGAKGEARVAVLILLHGPAAIEIGGGTEEKEIKGAAHIEERGVEEWAFPIKQNVVAEGLGHPVPKILGKKEKKRQGKQDKDGEAASHGFQEHCLSQTRLSAPKTCFPCPS